MRHLRAWVTRHAPGRHLGQTLRGTTTPVGPTAVEGHKPELRVARRKAQGHALCASGLAIQARPDEQSREALRVIQGAASSRRATPSHFFQGAVRKGKGIRADPGARTKAEVHIALPVGLFDRRRQAKLARSAGASPARVRPSKPPGSECCVRRRRRRTRSVHSGCVGCAIEPRNGQLVGAEIVVKVECNMSNAVMRGTAALPGSKSTSRANGSRRNLGGPASGRHLMTPAVRIGKARSRSR